ncbi:hypothetical protein ACQV9O_27295, partial [Ralstonia pseudosolanacearum]|uniref:hypothetical protein n=1 Tax=Ralstonia pseudosolanacearum TaxID=1310165 RepID=UPI003D2D65FD
ASGGTSGDDANKDPALEGDKGTGEAGKAPDAGADSGGGAVVEEPDGTPAPDEDESEPPEAPAIGELPGPFPQLTATEVQAVRSAVVVTKGQSSANAQTSAQAQAPQSGFHVKAEPAVPASHYEVAPVGVNINVCAGDECRSLKLDASKPTE